MVIIQASNPNPYITLLRRSRTTGLRLSKLLHLRPETSFCHVVGELCPCLFVFALFVLAYLFLRLVF